MKFTSTILVCLSLVVLGSSYQRLLTEEKKETSILKDKEGNIYSQLKSEENEKNNDEAIIVDKKGNVYTQINEE